jgi:hypothetical protein
MSTATAHKSKNNINNHIVSNQKIKKKLLRANLVLLDFTLLQLSLTNQLTSIQNGEQVDVVA